VEEAAKCFETLLARGEKVYGVNTGVGGNIGFSLSAEQVELFQQNLMSHLSCATGAPLPADIVRAAMLLPRRHIRDRRVGGARSAC